MDGRYIDLNLDGYWDGIHIISERVFIFDEDFDGTYDTRGYDDDDDWWPDRFEQIK